MISNTNSKGEIILRQNGLLMHLFIDDILYCKAEGSYTRIYQQNQLPAVLICKSIGSFASYKDIKCFIRCHKSYLVNIKKVNNFCSKKRLLSVSDSKIPIARRKSDEVYRILLHYGIVDVRNIDRS